MNEFQGDEDNKKILDRKIKSDAKAQKDLLRASYESSKSELRMKINKMVSETKKLQKEYDREYGDNNKLKCGIFIGFMIGVVFASLSFIIKHLYTQ